MSYIMNLLKSMWDILAGISPIGINPMMFWMVFILAFGVIFLALQLIHLFKGNRGIAAIVGLVISYFVASSGFAVIIISRLFPNLGVAFMALIGLLLVVAFISPNSLEPGKFTAAPVIVIITFLIVIWLTYSAAAPELAAAGYISETTGVYISNEDVAAVSIILIIIGILWMVFRKPGNKEPSNFFKVPKWMFGKEW